jgi:hypothetical protein
MKKNWDKAGIVLLIAIATSLSSCGSKTSDKQPIASSPTNPTTTTVAQNSNTATLTDSVKFKLESGADAFSLKPKENGAKFVDVNDKELARLTVDANQKVKIKDASDKVLGYVVKKEGYWKIEDANQTKELFILRHQSDGDYKLEDGTNTEIYRIKARSDGFEIETPQKQSLYKVKAKEGKTSLKNASEKTVLSTKSKVLPIAVACFGFDKLSREQKAALAYAVNLSGGR